MEIKNKDWMDKKFIRINHRALEEGLFKINSSTLKVLLARLLLTNDNNVCDFSSYWVSRSTGLSLGTVIKAEKELERLGWLFFSRQGQGGIKKRGQNGTWAKNTCKIGHLPDYLRGVFRDEDRDQKLTTVIEPTVDNNSVTEKSTTNSLKVEDSLVVSSTQQLFEKLFFPLKGERDALVLQALQKRYGDEKLQRFFSWFKEEKKKGYLTSIGLFNKVIPEWEESGEPSPPPKFVPCGKCENGDLFDKEKQVYFWCECKIKWEEGKIKGVL